jgi:hypothetical protein
MSLNVRVDRGLPIISPLSDHQSHWGDPNSRLPFNEKQIVAICNLLNRDWFQRLWIWQEVRLAKDAIVICGSESISWKAFRTAFVCLWVKPRPSILRENISVRHEELLYHLSEPFYESDFLMLINYTKYSLCSDPRDRIFALLSLLPECKSGLKVQPDYTKSASKVYQDFMVNYIKSQGLRILTQVELHDSFQGAPSWVPNWSVPRKARPLANVFAGLACSASISFNHGAGTLNLTGTSVATVTHAEQFQNPEKSTYFDIMIEVERIARKMSLGGFVKGRPEKLRELCRVLGSNNLADQYFPASTQSHPTIQQGEDFLRKVLMALSVAEDESIKERQLRRAVYSEIMGDADRLTASSRFNISFINANRSYINCVGTFCSDRSVFKTTEGHIGLGPKVMKVGDIVTVLVGCNSAMILRSVQAEKYLVVGESYCSGIMGGSVLLGPMLGSFDIVYCYSKRLKTHVPGFINQDSGKVQFEDLRVVNIPRQAGWRREEHGIEDEDFVDWYVNDETGEHSKSSNLNLISLEALKSRGVELRAFTLV